MEETEESRRRAAQNELLIEALAAGRSYAQASSAVGISERTIARRMSDPVFAAEVARRRSVWAAEMVGELTAMGPDALLVLRQVLAEGNMTERLRAVKLALTLGSTFRREGDLELRVAMLEGNHDDGHASPARDAAAEG